MQQPAAGATSDAAALGAEWASSKQTSEADAALVKPYGGQGAKKISMLVAQGARVHSVNWEKATDCIDAIREMRTQSGANAELAARACASAFGKRVVGQGETLVDKQPGMAYALASMALQAGEAEPLIWESIAAQVKAKCPYCVPYYVPNPPSGNAEEWKQLLGYKSGEKKADYYARMGAMVYLYAALLQQTTAGTFNPPNVNMVIRPIVNPLGVRTAWTWLARLLNQKPKLVTPTILLAFLKPSAHALAAAYPRQFGKLLRHCRTVFVPKLHALIDNADKPEEKAALMTLEGWLDKGLAELAAGRPLVIPSEAEMPEFKPPDDTGEGGDDSW